MINNWCLWCIDDIRLLVQRRLTARIEDPKSHYSLKDSEREKLLRRHWVLHFWGILLHFLAWELFTLLCFWLLWWFLLPPLGKKNRWLLILGTLLIRLQPLQPPLLRTENHVCLLTRKIRSRLLYKPLFHRFEFFETQLFIFVYPFFFFFLSILSYLFFKPLLLDLFCYNLFNHENRVGSYNNNYSCFIWNKTRPIVRLVLLI